MSTTRPDRQRGFALASAIFILVVLAALGAYLLTVFTNEETGQVQDIQGARAYQAARAGLEWASYQVLDPRNTGIGAPATCAAPVTDFTNFPGCPAVAFPTATAFAGTDLAGYAVTVACFSTDHTEAGRNIRIYELAATARVRAGTRFATERLLRMRVALCRDPNGDPGAQPPCTCL